MKQIFYKILISLCMLHVSDVIKSSEVAIEDMDVEQLIEKKSKLNNKLSNILIQKNKQEKDIINKEIRDIDLMILQKKTHLNPKITGTKELKQVSSEMRKALERKNPLKQSKVEHYLKDIQNIQKLVATSDTLFVMYKEVGQPEKKDAFKIIALDPNNDFSSKNKTIEDAILPRFTKVYNAEPEFSNIATYHDSFVYGYSVEKKSNVPFQSQTHAAIFFFGKWGDKPFGRGGIHKTFIESLFLDDQLIVSHSKAGNIRFCSIDELKTDQDTSLLSYLHRAFVENKEEYEYKADRLVAYKNCCMVYEKSSILAGIALYVAYINGSGKIMVEKKIDTYQKDKGSPFLAAIQENGNAILYNQHTRSLTVCSKNNDGKIVDQYVELPKQLMYRVAQQIHYIDDKAILVYDDQIYEISWLISNKVQAKRIFHIRSSVKSAIKGLVQSDASKYFKTIATTALQGNDTLWIISLKEEKQPNEQYTIQSIALGKESV